MSYFLKPRQKATACLRPLSGGLYKQVIQHGMSGHYPTRRYAKILRNLTAERVAHQIKADASVHGLQHVMHSYGSDMVAGKLKAMAEARMELGVEQFAQEYRRLLRKETSHGGEHEIKAMSVLFGIHFVIHNFADPTTRGSGSISRINTVQHHHPLQTSSGIGEPVTATVHLMYFKWEGSQGTTGHYDLLVPRVSAADPTSVLSACLMPACVCVSVCICVCA